MAPFNPTWQDTSGGQWNTPTYYAPTWAAPWVADNNYFRLYSAPVVQVTQETVTIKTVARIALARTRVPPRPVGWATQAGLAVHQPVRVPRRTPVRGHVGWIRRGGRRPL